MSFAVAASRLTNPFIGEIPKRVEARIKPQIAAAAEGDEAVEFTCLAFNDRGSYLACGTQVGDLVVLDMATLAPSCRVASLHDKEIVSVSWRKPGKGRQICTVSADGVKVYCLETARVVSELVFPDSNVMSAVAHPSDLDKCLVSLDSDESGIPWPGMYSFATNTRLCEFRPPGEFTKSAKLAGVCAIFSLHGPLVFVGGMGNSIHVFLSSTGQFLQSFFPDTTKGKSGWCVHLALSRNGRVLAAVGLTKMISIFDVSSDWFANHDYNQLPGEASLEQIQAAMRWRAGQILRFKRHVFDLVSNTKWNGICCSGSTGEFLLAVNAQKDLHELNVWDVTSGRLIEVLKDDLQPKAFGFVTACVWHPFRALVATVNGNGQVCLWGNQPQASKKFSTTAASSTEDKSWLAFVPEFVEIEENEIYQSKPDDDNDDESNRHRAEMQDNNRKIIDNEECEVDVLDMGFLPQNATNFGESSSELENEDSDDEQPSVRDAPRRVTKGIGYFIPVNL